ncbi:MAG: hypothetical protein HY088_02510 [Ignavibacteriales bacterium]|nr:hypothetical protein [Ignavibacteriales bacterium]
MRTLYSIIALLLLFSATTVAQRFQARLVSSAYAWERQDSVGTSSQHLFGYQTVQLSLAGENLSCYTYVQGFNDFTGPVKNDPLVRLYNFYFKWSNIANIGEVTLGREAIFAGVGTGTIDGGTIGAKFFDSRLRVLGYYGLLPAPRMKAELIGDRKNNFMTGGQIVGSPVEFAQVSLSYTKKHIKPDAYLAIRRDSLFNPYTIEIKPTAEAEEYLSGDVNVEYAERVSGYARYDYDMLLEKMSRLQLFTRVKVLEPLSITGEYIQREPRLFYNSIFSVFTYNTLKEYEAGAEYSLPWNVQVFGKYGSVSYGDGETSQRITVGANSKHASLSLSRNVGYAGELSAASVTVGYPFCDNKLTPTFMLSYARYKLSENASLDNALSMALGAVYRPIQVLSFDTQLQWVQNKIYSKDMRLFVRASYFFSHQLGIF